jgi:hypothetical protein
MASPERTKREKRSPDRAPAKAEERRQAAIDADESSLWEDLREWYLTFDRRTLGLTRLFIGFYLIFDLLRRTQDWWKMF